MHPTVNMDGWQLPSRATFSSTHADELHSHDVPAVANDGEKYFAESQHLCIPALPIRHMVETSVHMKMIVEMQQLHGTGE